MNKIGQKLLLATALSTATGACDQIQEQPNQQIATIQQSVTASVVEPISQTVERQVVPATFRCTEIPGAISTDNLDILFNGAVNTGQIYTRRTRTNQPFRGEAMDLSDSTPIDFRAEIIDDDGNPIGEPVSTPGAQTIKYEDMYYSFLGNGLYAAHPGNSATLRYTPENFGSIGALSTPDSPIPAVYIVENIRTNEQLYEQRINTETHELEPATLIGSMPYFDASTSIGCTSMTYVDSNLDTTYSNPVAIDSVICSNIGTGYEMLTIQYDPVTGEVLDEHLQITTANRNFIRTHWHPDFRSNPVGRAFERSDTDHRYLHPGAFSSITGWYLLDQCNVDTTEIATTICPPSSELTCLDTLHAPSSTTGFCEDGRLPVCRTTVIVEPDAGDSDADAGHTDATPDTAPDSDAGYTDAEHIDVPEVGDATETDTDTQTDAEQDTPGPDANDASEIDVETGDTGDTGNPEIGHDASETDGETDTEQDTSNPDASPDSSNDTGRTDTGNPEVGHDASETDVETGGGSDTGTPDAGNPDTTPPTPPRAKDEGCSTGGGTPATPGAALLALIGTLFRRKKTTPTVETSDAEEKKAA